MVIAVLKMYDILCFIISKKKKSKLKQRILRIL